MNRPDVGPEPNEEEPGRRRIYGWFLILVVGGPAFLMTVYAIVHVLLPSADTNLILFSLIVSAFLAIGLALVLSFVRQEMHRPRSLGDPSS